MNYEEFLKQKKHSSINYGIEPIEITDSMFDFQKHITEYAIKKGRCANFIDTGLGKTLIELNVANNYVKHTNKPALIITPLAVAYQFIKEAEKFGIDDVEYSKDGIFTKKIVICNYERLSKFNCNDFDCVILDESSILKNFDGAIKAEITQFMKRVKYRYLFTATPSPNDFVELGTSSEALGYLGYQDMLNRFFANNENNIRPQDIGVKWYLKPHATDDFFSWVKSWSISMRKPSDFGFSDENHKLPKLNVRDHSVKYDGNWVVDNQILAFGIVARRMGEVRAEQKLTTQQRCELAVSLKSDCCVYWVNFNQESELIKELDTEAMEIKGSMKLEKKEEILLGFQNGEVKRLITKPKITAFGLNWQHCNHTIYFPTFSYEQYYQAIRRFWRFGQKNEVLVDLVYSDGQKRIIDALLQKNIKMNELFTKLNDSLHKDVDMKRKDFNKKLILPKF